LKGILQFFLGFSFARYYYFPFYISRRFGSRRSLIGVTFFFCSLKLILLCLPLMSS